MNIQFYFDQCLIRLIPNSILPVSHSLTQTQRTNSAQTQTLSITLKDSVILLGVCYVQWKNISLRDILQTSFSGTLAIFRFVCLFHDNDWSCAKS